MTSPLALPPRAAVADRLRQVALTTSHRVRGNRQGQIGRQLRGWDRPPRFGPPANARDDWLRQILVHARAAVPHYATLCSMPEAQLAADPLAALRALPVLRKEQIRDDPAALTARGEPDRHVETRSTSGSTGTPTRFLIDRQQRSWVDATQSFCFAWAGRQIGQRIAWVKDLDPDPPDGPTLRRQAIRLVTGATVVTGLTPATMSSLLSHMNARPFRLVVGYSSSVWELARFAEAEGISVRPQHAVSVTSETLHPHMRTTIERVFGCPVYQRYGCAELGEIACECPEASRLHVLPWAAQLELLDEADHPVGPGQTGRVVLSTLHNRVMPLLRYDTGDVARLDDEDCPCGRPGLVFAQVLGRANDVIRTPTGARIGGGFFSHLLADRGWGQQFQVRQRTLNEVVVSVISLPDGVPAHERDELVSAVQRAMGAGCRVELRLVDELPRLPSGKYRWVISEIDSSYPSGPGQLSEAR